MDPKDRELEPLAPDPGGSDDRRLSRRQFVELSAGLGLGLVVTDLAEAGTVRRGSEAASSSVRFLIAENFWADWEPYQNTAQSQWRINQHIYDHLVEFPTGDVSKPKPALATSWRRINPTTWEFKLRRGVRFHDGHTFKAKDVKASIELASGVSGKSVDAGLFWVPTRVQIVDAYTVRLHTKGPFGALFSALQHSHIVSAADLAGAKAKLKKHPNGTGPFRLVKDEPTKKTMAANTRYWRAPPKITNLVWEFVQDPQTRLNALLAGQAHAIDRVPPEHFKIIQRSSKLALASVTGLEQVNLWVRPGRSDVWASNPHFRLAANWAVDRDALVKNLVGGHAAAARSYVPKGTLFWQPQSPRFTFNAAKAKAELQAGNLAGRPPEFELWVAKGFLPRAPEVVQSIVNSMQQVGLKPKVVTSDVAGMIDDIFSKTGTGLMYHLSWSSNGDPATAFQVYSPAFAWNFGDQTIDQLIAAGLTETNQAKRRSIYGKLQAQMWQQSWHVPLYYSDFTVAHSKKLHGLVVLPNFSTYFYPARLT